MPGGLKVWGLLLTCLAALLYCFSGLSHHPPPPAALLFALGAVWMETRSLRLPGAGLVSCSFVFLLAFALLDGVGPGWPSGLACILVILRSGLLGSPEVRLRWLEGLLDLNALLLTLAATQLVARSEPGSSLAMRGGAGTFVYCLLMLEVHLLLTGELAEGQRSRYKSVQLGLFGVRLAGCCAALLMAWLASQPGAWVLLCFPTVDLLPRVAKMIVRGEEEEQRNNVLRQLDASKNQLAQASASQKILKETLDRRVDENRILEKATQTLLQVRNLQQTADQIVQLCGSLVRAESVAVFLLYENRLYPRSCQSPQLERLQQANLLQLSEPAVDEAWRTGAVQRIPIGSNRIFANEDQIVVFPLGRAGALYIGRSGAPFSEIELRHLSQAASQGTLAVQIALHLEALEGALYQQERYSNELQFRAGVLDRLLSSSLGFLDKMDREIFLEKLTLAAGALFAHDSLEVRLESLQGPIAEHILSTRLPLLLEDVSQSRFEPHRPGQRSLLAVPIFHPDLHKVGLILMGALVPQAFSRWHQDSLSLLGTLAAVAWKNLELHAETLAAQGQLVQSSKMAAVGQLAAGVAHEMNTPLGSVMLNVESAIKVLRSNPNQAETRLSKAKEMVQRTRGIVEKLLYYSRQSEHGRVLTDLNNLVADTLQLVGHSLTIDQVKVETQAGQVRKVPVNQNEIQQVICNLLLNARDAMLSAASSPRNILISTFEENQWACIAVRDSGPGMTPDVQARVLEPFFTTKEVGKGTGLGLSISQQILVAHNGQLKVESVPGQGSQFTIQLPLPKL
ncbi:GAF domain-containing sensor histidine kinase [bacterium]|nr:GAF domain-containing sensor histidine kinase [bacterium]